MLKNKGRFMKKGFTLAEVLITLSIIGIVAALTIPSVISNYQQQEFKTGLKKAVSVLNEAIQTNIAQDGETPYDNSNIFRYLQRHMSVIKTLPYNATKLQNDTFYTTDGMKFMVAPPNYYCHVLHEGGCAYVTIMNCGSYGLINNPNKTTNVPCLIIADVNGDKKPNPQYIANKKSGDFDILYSYPSFNDKKVLDAFPILITDEKAIPFGVVAQRAMYSK